VLNTDNRDDPLVVRFDPQRALFLRCYGEGPVTHHPKHRMISVTLTGEIISFDYLAHMGTSKFHPFITVDFPDRDVCGRLKNIVKNREYGDVYNAWVNRLLKLP